MNTVLEKSLYKNYYKFLHNSFVTGNDKVTTEIFKKNFNENYNIISRKITNYTYKYTRLKYLYKNGRKVYIPTIRDRLVLEHLKNCIKQKYKLKISSRENIVYDIKCLCEEPIDYYIIRADLKSFFNNISHIILQEKISKSSLLNSNQMYLVNQLLLTMPEDKGVPQGIGISNYLAELYLEKFDYEIKALSSQVFYYSRYVDDILIMIPGKVTKQEQNVLKEKLNYIINKYDLILNDSKTKYIQFYKDNSQTSFMFLGYEYTRVDKKLIMRIAPYKLNQLREKISTIFNAFTCDLNFTLLYERVRNFTSTNKVYRTKCQLTKNEEFIFRRYSMLYGINSDYKYANEESIIKLNKYIKYLICSDNNLNRKQKRLLYGILIPVENGKERFLDINRLTINEIRSIVHKMDTRISWSSLISSTKLDLIKLYYDLLKRY